MAVIDKNRTSSARCRRRRCTARRRRGWRETATAPYKCRETNRRLWPRPGGQAWCRRATSSDGEEFVARPGPDRNPLEDEGGQALALHRLATARPAAESAAREDFRSSKTPSTSGDSHFGGLLRRFPKVYHFRGHHRLRDPVARVAKPNSRWSPRPANGTPMRPVHPPAALDSARPPRSFRPWFPAPKICAGGRSCPSPLHQQRGPRNQLHFSKISASQGPGYPLLAEFLSAVEDAPIVENDHVSLAPDMGI